LFLCPDVLLHLLIWEIWKSDGWNRYGSPIGVNPFSTGIDPDDIPPVTPSFPVELTLPLSLNLDPDEYTGQAILYALRSVTPVASDQVIEIRSNPLLISLYRERLAA
jgi:hypothetical protein